MTFLGLDYGQKRIGVAVSDPGNVVALIRPPIIEANPLKKIARICRENQIDKIVIGLPLNLSGEDTAQTDEVKNFAAKIKAQLGYPVFFSDERFTSKIALQTKREEKKKIRQKKDEDSIAAVLILQSYLDQINQPLKPRA